MDNIFTKTAIFIVLLIIILAFVGTPASANEPTAVGLESFTLTPLNNAVRIDWETGSESGTLAFIIKRGTNGSEQHLDYLGDNGFIYAEGGVAIGHDYSVTDNQVQNGDTHTYILVEIEHDNSEHELDRATVTVGIPATSTPAIIQTDSAATSTSPSTGQSTATIRPTATATSASGADNSINVPTSTPRRIVTVTPRPTATPKNTAAPTAAIVSNSSSSNQGNKSQSEATPHSSAETDTANTNPLGVNDVFAQDEETTSPTEVANVSWSQAQETYPVSTPTAVSVDTYPDHPNSPTAVAPTTDSVPVIGNPQGYNPQSPVDQPENAGTSNADSAQSNLFLWFGFIVALLIFATGLIGSIILFTRKAK
ncbi:MAG: hypothetical protein CSB13_07050 [Chloroflexi bacterium]|nr:MAG: hypothetical protein CSB13_07050 [Chloroflexota bacterium]